MVAVIMFGLVINHLGVIMRHLGRAEPRSPLLIPDFLSTVCHLKPEESGISMGIVWQRSGP